VVLASLVVFVFKAAAYAAYAIALPFGGEGLGAVYAAGTALNSASMVSVTSSLIAGT
jgi:hypothetical protein